MTSPASYRWNIALSRVLIASIAVLCSMPSVFAGVGIYDDLRPLNGEYTVLASATQLAPTSFRFTYSITNNNQGSGSPVGLDGFYLDVPVSTNVTNVVNPAPYIGSPGFWEFYEGTSNFSGCKRLSWWGGYEQSVYPIGKTAQFSFQADGVAVGSINAEILTYKYGEYRGGVPYWYYTPFSTTTTGPVAVPEPSTFALLGMGVIGLLGWAWRKRK